MIPLYKDSFLCDLSIDLGLRKDLLNRFSQDYYFYQDFSDHGEYMTLLTNDIYNNEVELYAFPDKDVFIYVIIPEAERKSHKQICLIMEKCSLSSDEIAETFVNTLSLTALNSYGEFSVSKLINLWKKNKHPNYKIDEKIIPNEMIA